MICTNCFKKIDKSRGYYLIMGAPYCIDCHEEPADAIRITGKIYSPADRRGSENLLEAFREYQRRDQKMVCRE